MARGFDIPREQLEAGWEAEEDRMTICEGCGHSWAQHSKGPVQATYCRHCPCPEFKGPRPGSPPTSTCLTTEESK